MRRISGPGAALGAAVIGLSGPAAAQEQAPPNVILRETVEGMPRGERQEVQVLAGLLFPAPQLLERRLVGRQGAAPEVAADGAEHAEVETVAETLLPGRPERRGGCTFHDPSTGGEHHSCRTPGATYG